VLETDVRPWKLNVGLSPRRCRLTENQAEKEVHIFAT